ncbi:MAG: ATP-binding cassette domain-containing protein [Roseiarcus sp.]
MSLSLDEGEALGVVGENGAGKSSLMRPASIKYPHAEKRLGDAVQIEKMRRRSRQGFHSGNSSYAANIRAGILDLPLKY